MAGLRLILEILEIFENSFLVVLFRVKNDAYRRILSAFRNFFDDYALKIRQTQIFEKFDNLEVSSESSQ